MAKTKTIAITVDQPTERAVAQRSSGSRDRSEIVRRAVRRYAELCERSMPEMSPNEWRLCCDALNGCWLLEGTERYAAHEVADAIRLNGLDAKWGVDGDALVERLGALSVAEVYALVDYVERWWAASARGEDLAIPGEVS